jgi:solute:Na+ symporter, SSS family
MRICRGAGIVWRVCALVLTLVGFAGGAAGESRFAFQELPSLPADFRGMAIAAQGETLIAAGGVDGAGGLSDGIFVLPAGAAAWAPAGKLETPRAWAAAAASEGGVILVAGETAEGASRDVLSLRYEAGEVRIERLSDLPISLARPAAVLMGNLLYVAGELPHETELWLGVWDRGGGGGWRPLAAPVMSMGGAPALAASQERIYLFGPGGSASYLPRDGWRELAPAPWWPQDPGMASFGHAHIFMPGVAPEGRSAMLLYHTYTGSWVEAPEAPWAYAYPRTVRRGGQVVIVDGSRVARLEILSSKTGYGWLDHGAVLLYLGGMVLMGFYFIRREKNTRNYFRAGNRIPWWAAGMSLFATGASAISLMSMPGKAFSSDLTYLGISLYAVVALPIALFVLAPLVRKLAIATPGEYLERRFGLAARMLAASIYCFTQVGARMGAVMLLPSIAISAVTGVPIWICILVMGVITTLYTYLGGLAAVIWTDTVQGFVMILSVVGCLVLALTWLNAPVGDAWTALQQFDKLVMFDLRWDLTYPTAYLLFVTTVLGTLGGIGDQNFVQRVQCTPNLKQTKMAVATQLMVAVPINILLFSLGLVLFLFYRSRPEQLDPALQTDGIFPFFVAQQLPPGVSGLVIAALLAATMSTISSSICAVANVGMEDFARRFHPQMSDRSATTLGRVLTALTGILGTGTALYLSQSSLPSVWDLAQMVTNLISNGIVGFFALGLLTRRAHQWGAMSGVACGMAAVFYLQNFTDVSFWAFTFVGTVVTFTSGYLFSVILPGRHRQISGLTVYTLREAAPKAVEALEVAGEVK